MGCYTINSVFLRFLSAFWSCVTGLCDHHRYLWVVQYGQAWAETTPLTGRNMPDRARAHMLFGSPPVPIPLSLRDRELATDIGVGFAQRSRLPARRTVRMVVIYPCIPHTGSV